MYTWIIVRQVDNLFDYQIFYNNEHIGSFGVTKHEDYTFLRHIQIFELFRRCHHAENFLRCLQEEIQESIGYSISTHSDLAIAFWNYFNEKYQNQVEHVIGDTYKIKWRP